MGDHSVDGKDVWKRPSPLGMPSSVSGFGTLAAPLLAGFSLTAVVEIVGRSERGIRGDIAILLFTLAAGFLIVAIQTAINGARYNIKPSEWVDWNPEMKHYDVRAQDVRRYQWKSERLAEYYSDLARFTFNAGIVLFVGGLISILIPGPGGWSVPRILAIAAAGMTVLLEVVLVLRVPFVVRLFTPTVDDVARLRPRAEFTPEEIDGRELLTRLAEPERES
ncbi:hypothetical protein [Pseudonocardia sp. NPDC046786]|uniref:hypothetical protein n=1 Tax=Pseudonocardia sp. NPDC046786 TaxID=3155471 RepID=UPI0033FEC9C0